MAEDLTFASQIHRAASRGGPQGAVALLDSHLQREKGLPQRLQREAAEPFADELRELRRQEQAGGSPLLNLPDLIRNSQDYVRGIQAGDERVIATALSEVSEAVKAQEAEVAERQIEADTLTAANPRYGEIQSQLAAVERELADPSLAQPRRGELDTTKSNLLYENAQYSQVDMAVKILKTHREILDLLRDRRQSLRNLLTFINTERQRAILRSAQQAHAIPAAQPVDARGAVAPNSVEIAQMLPQLVRAEAGLVNAMGALWRGDIKTWLDVKHINVLPDGSNREEALAQLAQQEPRARGHVQQYNEFAKWSKAVQQLRTNPSLLNHPDWANFARWVVGQYGQS